MKATRAPKSQPASSASSSPKLSAAVGRELVRRGQTLALAESCTGGLISAYVTAVPGSSRYFLEGAVTYSNAAKRRVLGVPAGLLTRHGAVSVPVAQAMAMGMRKRSGADWAGAVTGIAGPGGGSREKPVGLVYLAVVGPDRRLAAEVHRFSGDRETVRRHSAKAWLALLKRELSRTSGSSHASAKGARHGNH